MPFPARHQPQILCRPAPRSSLGQPHCRAGARETPSRGLCRGSNLATGAVVSQPGHPPAGPQGRALRALGSPPMTSVPHTGRGTLTPADTQHRLRHAAIERSVGPPPIGPRAPPAAPVACLCDPEAALPWPSSPLVGSASGSPQPPPPPPPPPGPRAPGPRTPQGLAHRHARPHTVGPNPPCASAHTQKAPLELLPWQRPRDGVSRAPAPQWGCPKLDLGAGRYRIWGWCRAGKGAQACNPCLCGALSPPPPDRQSRQAKRTRE